MQSLEVEKSATKYVAMLPDELETTASERELHQIPWRAWITYAQWTACLSFALLLGAFLESFSSETHEHGLLCEMNSTYLGFLY